VVVKRDELVKFAVNFINKNYRFPAEKDFISAGYTRDMIRSRFGSIALMRDILIDEAGLANYISERTYNREHSKYLQERVAKKKVFIVSSFVCGTKVNKKFFSNLQVLADHYNGEVLLVPVLDSANKSDKFFDRELLGTLIVTDHLDLNSNISISNISVSARAVDPSSGLPRIGQRNGSTIIGSTKQVLKYVPTGIASMPHALMSTGVVTEPTYYRSSLFKTKAARIAEEDHKLGAVVVEIENDEIYHFRHIEAGPSMEIIDLGTMVKNGKVSKVAPEALVLGDWHSGKTNVTVAKQTKHLSGKLGISRWILHDIFDGDAINHHDNGKHLTRAKKANRTGLSLDNELVRLAKDIRWMQSFLDDIVIVRSNHDEFLDLYLNTGKYVDDPLNHETALELALEMVRGNNPLERGVSKCLNDTTNVRWLKRDQSYKIAGIECGHHGDAGANGARPSVNAIENAYKKSVTGHSHTPQILRDVYVVGTSTDTKPDYGKGGPNSWMNTHCIVYPNGTRQLVNMIEGKFTTLL
jgi:hypothetical protein